MFKVNVQARNMNEVQRIRLQDAELQERYDLQEWIVNNPSCLGEPFLLIQKEFSAWGDQSSRRLDMLLLDKQGNLVIVENKRDLSEREVVAQALTYASFCKTMTQTRVLDELHRYREGHGVAEGDGEAEDVVCECLGIGDINEAKINSGMQRIIIVAGDFPVEVTSSVLWLREFGVDISCVRYALYEDEGRLYVDFDTILPTPGMEQFQIRMAERRAEDVSNSESSRQCNPEYRNYWECVNRYLAENADLQSQGFVSSAASAASGKQWYTFTMPGKPYSFALRLYGRKGQVGVCVSVNTGDPTGAAFIAEMEHVRDDINAAFCQADPSSVLWGMRTERTVSVKLQWNRENPVQSIENQFSALMRLKNVLDQLVGD